ncbi:hypothetical protein GCK32_007740, partial [Trichostrongylus colubriformis]
MQTNDSALLGGEGLEDGWNYTNIVCGEQIVVNYTYSERDYGELEMFYQRVAAVIKNPKEASELIILDVFKNGYIVAVLLVCFFISLITLITCVFAGAAHAFRGGKKPPSTGTITCAMLSFVCCLVLAAAGTYLFTHSIKHIKYGLDSLPKQLQKSTSDISRFVEGFGENLRCNFFQGEKMVEMIIDNFIVNITAVLSATKNRIDPDNIPKVFSIVDKIRHNLNFTQWLLQSVYTNIPAREQLVNISMS